MVHAVHDGEFDISACRLQLGAAGCIHLMVVTALDDKHRDARLAKVRDRVVREPLDEEVLYSRSEELFA